MAAYTDEQILAVRAYIVSLASGSTAERVKFGDREVTLTSLSQARALLEEMEADNAAIESGASNTRYAAFDKGLSR